jgi:hypothetical protein
LDRLAVVFGDDLLPVLMPIVEGRLADQDWRARESAILALGAVAEGCHQVRCHHVVGRSLFACAISLQHSQQSESHPIFFIMVTVVGPVRSAGNSIDQSFELSLGLQSHWLYLPVHVIAAGK